MFDLSGKTALITGSSRGIGRAIAETMAAAGARVVITSRKADACTAVADGLKSAGHEAMAVPCNVSQREDVERLVDETLGTWKRIDILVCNAATNPVFGWMSKVDDDAFDKIMRTNVRANMWLCRLILPQMAERGSGSVVLVGSIAGVLGTRGIGTYGLSKAADAQLARNLAVEWGAYGIRANAIAPGLIRTDFARALWEDEDISSRVQERTPLARVGEPRDVAGVALFLASDASRYMTGQTLLVDGGLSIADPF